MMVRTREAKASHDELIREIDAIISYEPAKQASLCDLVASIRQMKETCDRYLAELRRVNDLCLSEIGMGLVDARVFPIGDVIEQWRKRVTACAEVTTAADLRAAGVDLPPEISDDAAMWPVSIQHENFTVTPTSTEEDIKNGVLTMDLSFDFAKFKPKP